MSFRRVLLLAAALFLGLFPGVRLAAATTVFRYSVFSDGPFPAIPDSGAAGNDGTANANLCFSSDLPAGRFPMDSGDVAFDTGTKLGGAVTNATLLLGNPAITAAGGFTMECWFRWNGGGTVNSIIDYAGTEKIVLDTRGATPGLVEFELNNALRFPIGVATPGEWHYVAVVFDTAGAALNPDGTMPGTINFYFDDVHLTSEAAATKSTFGDGLDRAIGVGQHPLGFAADFFDGLIFEPRVSLGAVTPTDFLLDGDLPGTLIEPGVPFDIELTAKEPFALFRLWSDPGRVLEVTITDGDASDHNDLFLRWGSEPHVGEFDLAADGPSVAASRRLVEPVSRADTAWILVDARSVGADSGNFVTILAEYRDLTLEDLSSERVGAGLEGRGALRARVLGGGFDAETEFSLEPSGGGAQVEGFDTVIVNGDRAEVVFDTSAGGLGAYDLVARRPGVPAARLQGAFEKTAGALGGVLEATVTGPRFVRTGRVGFLSVRYRNTGDAGMLAPLMKIRGPAATRLRLEGEETFASGEVYALGVHPNGVPGFLPPGGEGVLSFEFENDCVDCVQDFELSFFTPGSTPLPLSTPSPPGFEPQEWEELWLRLFDLSELRTWEDYHALLASTAGRLSRRGRNAASVRQGFDLQLRRVRDQPVAAIVGRLRCEDTRAPISGQTIRALLDDQVVACSVTDRLGSFVLEELFEGVDYFLDAPPLLPAGSVREGVPLDRDLTGLEVLASSCAAVDVGCPVVAPARPEVFPAPPAELFTALSTLRAQTVSAVDPNEKEGPTGPDPLAARASRSGGAVRPGERLVYTIHFENEGSAAAQRIEIIDDRLDPALFDLESIELIAVELGPSNRFQSFRAGRNVTCTGIGQGDVFSGLTRLESTSPLGFQVRELQVLGGGDDFALPLCMDLMQEVSSAAGVVCWVLEGRVDPGDPLGGILPPNDTSHRGEGRVVFSVRLRADAALGDFENDAQIVFDNAGPIRTEPWRNTVSLGQRFERCDANDDGEATIADASFALNFLFLGGSRPACVKAADCDDSGELELTDAVFHLNFLFLGGERPSLPSGSCGLDPTSDDLSCDAVAACD